MRSRQITNNVLMVRPAHFGYNTQTAVNNTFQTSDDGEDPKQIAEKAIQEFDNLVRKLRDQEIEVMICQDSEAPKKADAVFPNNWISTHQDGVVITYPMFAEIRRAERRDEIVDELTENYKMKKRYSFEYYESEDKYLEGTGSMVLDRKNKIVYASLSVRTDPKVLEKFAILKNYRKVVFHSTADGQPIYHTNVMMAMGTTFVIICMACISDETEQKALRASFAATNKHIIEISIDQMNSFAGNMLQLGSEDGNHHLVMSEQAFKSLEPEQVKEIQSHSEILYAPIETIEKYGGGSVRCMIAENFLPLKSL